METVQYLALTVSISRSNDSVRGPVDQPQSQLQPLYARCWQTDTILALIWEVLVPITAVLKASAAIGLVLLFVATATGPKTEESRPVEGKLRTRNQSSHLRTLNGKSTSDTVSQPPSGATFTAGSSSSSGDSISLTINRPKQHRFGEITSRSICLISTPIIASIKKNSELIWLCNHIM